MIGAINNNLIHASSIIESYLLKNHVFLSEINLEDQKLFKLLESLIKYENRKVKLFQLIDNYNVFGDDWNDFRKNILDIENKIISCILEQNFHFEKIKLIKNNFWLIDGLIKVKIIEYRINVTLLKDKKQENKTNNTKNHFIPKNSHEIQTQQNIVSNIDSSSHALKEKSSLLVNNTAVINSEYEFKMRNSSLKIKNEISDLYSEIDPESSLVTGNDKSSEFILQTTENCKMKQKTLTNKERKAERKKLKAEKSKEIQKKQIEKFRLKSQLDLEEIIDYSTEKDYDENIERIKSILKQPGKSFAHFIEKDTKENNLDFAHGQLCKRHCHEVISEHQQRCPHHNMMWVLDVFDKNDLSFNKMNCPPKTKEEVIIRNTFIQKWKTKWINETNLRGKIDWEEYWIVKDFLMKEIFSKMHDISTNLDHNQKMALDH
jgi:hypothetical protein